MKSREESRHKQQQFSVEGSLKINKRMARNIRKSVIKCNMVTPTFSPNTQTALDFSNQKHNNVQTYCQLWIGPTSEFTSWKCLIWQVFKLRAPNSSELLSYFFDFFVLNCQIVIVFCFRAHSLFCWLFKIGEGVLGSLSFLTFQKMILLVWRLPVVC